MRHITVIEDLPKDLQLPMIKVPDTFERDMNRKPAVRREDFDRLNESLKDITLGAQTAAREEHIFLLQNGRKLFWEEALKESLTN